MRAILIVLFAIALMGCGSKTPLEIPVCEDGAVCCVPAPESCNGIDDDCDGVVDDGTACFFLDGEPLEALVTDRCGAEWYSYHSPDLESANPQPDIRRSGGVVVAAQYASHCEGASVAVIADFPMDGSGGELNARFAVSPVGVASLLVGDEPRECGFDAARGAGSCEWVWQACCTDGLLIGPFSEDGCVTITLSGAVGVSAPVVHDGPERTLERAYDEPMEICAQIRPPA